MYLKLSKEQLLKLEKEGNATFISLWNTIEKASTFYSTKDGLYSAYIEKDKNLTTAYATPVRVFKIHKAIIEIQMNKIK